MEKLVINDFKINECLLLLHRYFNDKENLANVDFPNNIEYKSEEWLHYVFYSCLLDYGMRSKIYHSNLIKTYENFSEIFNPRYVVDNYSNESNELLIILKEYVHPRYPNVALKKWIDLSRELCKYDNLKSKILSLGSFDDLNRFIRSINGYGQKTGGLLLRLISDSDVCGFGDGIASIPLDRHDIEICWLNGIINKSKLAEKEIEFLSTSLINNGLKLDISPSTVDKYLWEIGNSFCNRKDCLNCPLYGKCKTKINK